MSAIFIGVGTLKGYWDANANQLYQTDNSTTVGTDGSSGGTGALTTGSPYWGSAFKTYASNSDPKVGDYLKVKTAGSTNLSDETNWDAGDYVVYVSGSVWQKVSATDTAAALIVGAADGDTWGASILNTNNTTMTFGIDKDNNADSGYFEWKNNNSTQIAKLDENGDFQIDGDLTVSGNDIKSSTGTAIALAGTDVQVQGVLAAASLHVTGNLTVAGTTTTVNSTTVTVADKNIELATGASSDGDCDGGGLTLKGATDKTILWTNSTDRWTYNQGIQVEAASTGDLTALVIKNNSTSTQSHGGQIRFDFNDTGGNNADGGYIRVKKEQEWTESDASDEDSKMEFDVVLNGVAGNALRLTSTKDAEVAGNIKVGGNIIQASDGGSTITMDTSDNVTIAGDLNVHGGNAVIKGANDASADLTLQADNSDDNGDDWKIVCNADQTLTLANNIDGGTFQNYVTFTPHVTPASSLVTTAGALQVNGHAVKNSSGEDCITFDADQVVTFPNHFVTTNGPTLNGSLTTIQHAGSVNVNLKGAAAGANASVAIIKNNGAANGDTWRLATLHTEDCLTITNDHPGADQPIFTLKSAAAGTPSEAIVQGTLVLSGNVIKNSASEETIGLDGSQNVNIGSGSLYVNTGNIGVGTSSPSKGLHVKNASGGEIMLNRTTGDTSNLLGAIHFGNSNVDAALAMIASYPEGTTDSACITFETEPAGGSKAERMRIASDGNVGIGTTNPEGKLHIYTGEASIAPSPLADELVVEGAGSTGISILTPNDQVGRLYFGDEDNAARAYVLYDHSIDMMKFSIASGNKMVIDNSGQVGIGVEDPDSKLEVGGRIHISGEETTPSAPSDGDGGYLYAKADGKIYWRSNELSETDLTTGGGGGGGGGAVSSVANGADNRIATFSSSDALNGEANLTFDGNSLAVEGSIDVSGSSAHGSRTQVDVHQFTGSLSLTASGEGGFNGGILASGYGDNFGLHLFASQYAGLGMQSIVDTNGRGSIEVFSTGGTPKHFKYQAGTTFVEGGGKAVNLAASGSSKFGTDVNSVHYFTGSVEVDLGGIMVHSSSNAANEYGIELPNEDDFIGKGKAFSWDTYSSIKFKTNVATFPDAMQTVNSLRGVTFDWKKSGKSDVGLIAEEVAPVLPQCVSYDRNNEIDGVNYAKIVSVLVQAVKEQNTIISKLQADIADLKTKV